MLLCGEEDEVKGQLSEQHQESGKLETEDKVRIIPSLLSYTHTYATHLPHHTYTRPAVSPEEDLCTG